MLEGDYEGLGAKKNYNNTNKIKRKSSRLEKKEREVQRTLNHRKRSGLEDI